jgi:hypothetical protein
MNVPSLFAAAALAAAAVAFPASAQRMKTVRGMVINMRIMNAITAEHVDSQHGVTVNRAP